VIYVRCLIVGTDRLGAAERVLGEKLGVKGVVHWDGRRKKLPSRLPGGVGLVVIYTGFVRHSMMWRARELARKAGIQVIFLRRGLSELRQEAIS